MTGAEALLIVAAIEQLTVVIAIAASLHIFLK